MWYDLKAVVHYVLNRVKRYQRHYDFIINEALWGTEYWGRVMTAVEVCEVALLLNISPDHYFEYIDLYNTTEPKPVLIYSASFGLSGQRIVENEEWDIAPVVRPIGVQGRVKSLVIRGWRLGVEGRDTIPLDSRIILLSAFTGLLSLRETTQGLLAWGKTVDGIPASVQGVVIRPTYAQLGDYYRVSWRRRK